MYYVLQREFAKSYFKNRCGLETIHTNLCKYNYNTSKRVCQIYLCGSQIFLMICLKVLAE